jgi:type IV pilus assembly protein PilF
MRAPIYKTKAMAQQMKSTGRLLAVAFVALQLLFSGCVTTEESVFAAKASKEKATEKEIEIALRYLAKKEPEIAIKRLSDVAKESPDSPRVYEVLGIAFQSTGEIELAEENYRKALRLDPSYTRGRSNYAAFLYTLQRYKDSCAEYEKVIDDVYYEKRARAFLNYGQCSVQLQQWDRAENAFKRALGLDRTLALAHQELAWVYYNKKEFAKASSALDQYRSMVTQSSPRALLLGIWVAREFDDRNSEASYALALRNLYPRSKEYLDYKQSMTHDQR